MADHVRLMFLAGSAREQSWNKKLAHLGAEIAHANGLPSTFADLGDYPMPLFDGDLEQAEGPPENALKLKHLMEQHQGIFIAAPEYNSSITPLLKNTLDWVSRIREDSEPALQVYKTRVFAIGGASPGYYGGARALLTVRQILQVGLGALVLPGQVTVPKATEAFEASGHLKDKALQERYKALIENLAVAATKLIQ